MAGARPVLEGCDPRDADVFVRDRVLALRATGRSGGERLAVVALADLAGGVVRPVPDRSWWEPGGPGAPADHGLRTDVAHLLLGDAGEGPLLAVWSRGGPHEVLDQDLEWCAALAQAADLRDVDVPPLVVVTRAGWWCHPTGGQRSWKRLRERGVPQGRGPAAGPRVHPRSTG